MGGDPGRRSTLLPVVIGFGGTGTVTADVICSLLSGTIGCAVLGAGRASFPMCRVLVRTIKPPPTAAALATAQSRYMIDLKPGVSSAGGFAAVSVFAAGRVTAPLFATAAVDVFATVPADDFKPRTAKAISSGVSSAWRCCGVTVGALLSGLLALASGNFTGWAVGAGCNAIGCA